LTPIALAGNYGCAAKSKKISLGEHRGNSRYNGRKLVDHDVEQTGGAVAANHRGGHEAAS
jgi:hypothetical protein